MQTIYLDISNKGVIPAIYAKQGDVGRKFEVFLTDSGLPYVPASGSAFSVWYSGASGEGNYTDIGDKSAFSVNGNKVAVELISQMLLSDGDGVLSLALNDPNGNQISTWNIPYVCESVPGANSEEAKSYYTAFSKAVEDLPYPDDSLSVPGKAADAAAVGTALAGKASTSSVWTATDPNNDGNIVLQYGGNVVPGGGSGGSGGSGIHIGTEPPTDKNVDVWIDTDEEAPESGGGIDVTAEVGQTIVVEEVDENGKPTKWKAADFPEAQQSDWNANEGEPGHVLNRTHYENGTETKTLFNATVTVANNQFQSIGIVPIVLGNTYTVTWDGTEYECVAFTSNALGYPAPALGNPYFSGIGENNGMPFGFVSAVEYGQCGGAAMVNGSHTIKITEEVKAYKKLDDCYLPYSARSYTIKLTTEDTQIVYGEITITRISYDEFADILWGGGSVLLDLSAIYSNTINLMCRPVSWGYVNGEVSLTFITSIVSKGDNYDACSVSSLTLTFANGTWTPPTE